MVFSMAKVGNMSMKFVQARKGQLIVKVVGVGVELASSERL